MTEEQKYELATLATEVSRLRRIYEAHALTNTPTDPVDAERVYALYRIAETEYMQAVALLLRFQSEVASS